MFAAGHSVASKAMIKNSTPKNAVVVGLAWRNKHKTPSRNIKFDKFIFYPFFYHTAIENTYASQRVSVGELSNCVRFASFVLCSRRTASC